MLTQLFPKCHARYTASPSAHWLEAFSQWLIERGYDAKPTQLHVWRLKKVLERHQPVPATGVFCARTLPKMFSHRKRAWSYQATRRAFHRFLSDRGAITSTTKHGRFSRLLSGYQRHLTELHGFAPSTTAQHVSTVDAFLSQSVSARSQLKHMSAEAIERFVVAAGRRVSRQTLQHIVARLRAFLRYCYDQGITVRRLDAIDTPRTYRDELPPRAIDWVLTQRLLSSIELNSKGGRRDLTMLHLMAHYGLRPSEIVALTLDSIDWHAKTLRVEQRKTRSALLLPLTERSVSLLRRYIRRGRPHAACTELFLRLRTPAGPIKHYAVGDAFKKRARESGLALEGCSAYGLRHGFAMRLLNQGVGVKAIGDLLGHRTLESTCVYLRLQTDALREVALPLPRLPSRAAGRRP